MAPKQNHRKQKIAVLGLGRYGSVLANELQEMGHEVIGIDHDSQVVKELSSELIHVAEAEASDSHALRLIGVAQCDAAVVAFSDQHLEASILATLTLKQEMQIPRVIAKAANQRHGEILSRVGADEIRFPDHESGRHLALAWSDQGHHADTLEIDESYLITRIDAPSRLVAEPLSVIENDFPEITIVAILKSGEDMIYAPDGSTVVLRANDILVLGGSPETMEVFLETYKEEQSSAPSPRFGF